MGSGLGGQALIQNLEDIGNPIPRVAATAVSPVIWESPSLLVPSSLFMCEGKNRLQIGNDVQGREHDSRFPMQE